MHAWRLRTYWNDGDETGHWYFAREEDARAQLFLYVKAWWDLDFLVPLPADPEVAITAYFEGNQTENWSLERIRIRSRGELEPIDAAFKSRLSDRHLNEPRFLEKQP